MLPVFVMFRTMCSTREFGNCRREASHSGGPPNFCWPRVGGGMEQVSAAAPLHDNEADQLRVAAAALQKW
eukprot:3188477-Amphidinium_carterae.1